MGNLTRQELIDTFQMQPLPDEGGYFSETYRSQEILAKSALPQRFESDRNTCTAIYYLLAKGEKSLLHRIKSDEVWNFYMGGPLTLVQLSPKGALQEITLGNSISEGHVLQHVVPHGYWFGAYPNTDTEYSFVGCTVSPGFDFADFELGDRESLLNQFPHAREQIQLLTN
jgi:uncharacterized protein